MKLVVPTDLWSNREMQGLLQNFGSRWHQKKEKESDAKKGARVPASSHGARYTCPDAAGQRLLQGGGN